MINKTVPSKFPMMLHVFSKCGTGPLSLLLNTAKEFDSFSDHFLLIL
jgi:hypothetical protein